MKAWRFGFPLAENDVHLIRLKKKITKRKQKKYQNRIIELEDDVVMK